MIEILMRFFMLVVLDAVAAWRQPAAGAVMETRPKRRRRMSRKVPRVPRCTSVLVDRPMPTGGGPYRS